MSLSNIHNVYFIGIGGIGMSAIAMYFLANGKKVAGYDKVSSKVTDDLQKKHIQIHFKDSVSYIPKDFLDPKKTIVVYTPAVPKNHSELLFFKQNKFIVLKRAEILGKITENTTCLAVAGTHGKTTTSAMLGHIMQPEKATVFLGGIAENYNSNLILGSSKISVVEADEFDKSFLHLSPNIACITNMDADHLDIYKNHKELIRSFNEFANKVLDKLIVAKGLPIKGLTYAIEEDADYKAYNIKIENGSYIFDVKTPTCSIKSITLQMPGKHNVMNALAALAIADVYGVKKDRIKKQLATFKGVQRRFSYKIKTENLVLIDDYAHHPSEIKAVRKSIRELYPKEKVLAVFQPHLFSRTKDFADEFAKELSEFDEVKLLEIYPARELPIKGINSKMLLQKITNKNKQLVSKDELVKEVLLSKAKIVVMMGAGDIGLEVKKVKEALKNKNK